jgi:monoamine oxidase
MAAQKALGKAVQGTLFFAGEATDLEETGTVVVAIRSGRRAARELVQALRS